MFLVHTWLLFFQLYYHPFYLENLHINCLFNFLKTFQIFMLSYIQMRVIKCACNSKSTKLKNYLFPISLHLSLSLSHTHTLFFSFFLFFFTNSRKSCCQYSFFFSPAIPSNTMELLERNLVWQNEGTSKCTFLIPKYSH